MRTVTIPSSVFLAVVNDRCHLSILFLAQYIFNWGVTYPDRGGDCLFSCVGPGVEHMPVAKEEAWVMLIEPNTTLNTGNTLNSLTVEDLDRI